MTKLYIYDCNYKNEFLEEIETEHPEQWNGTSTEIPYVKSNIIGTSFAFNTETQQWDILIDDWRGITLYRKSDSRVSREGNVGKKDNGFIEIAPPDTEKQYIWNEEASEWELYIEPINISALIKSYEDAIQRHIDEVAQARGYDNGYTCASYADDKNARFASDARIFKDWRSDIWVYVNNLLNQYAEAAAAAAESGIVPTDIPSIEDILNNLPAIEWEEL
jgi:hypothetical protein